MARSDTQGLVYECKECGWRGEKCYGVAHVAKKHVKYAKFYCHVCKVGAATEQAIDKHVEQKRHCRRAADYEGEATTYHANNKPELLLKVWSKEESEKFWKKNEEERHEKKMKEEEEKEAAALETKRGKREADRAKEEVEDQKKETEAAGAPESKRRKLETEEESRQEEPHRDAEMEEETREEDLTEIEEEVEKKEDEKTEEENEDRRPEQEKTEEEEKKEEKTEEEEKKGKEPEKTQEETEREQQRHVEKAEEEKKEKEPEKTQEKSEREKQRLIEKTAENEAKSKEEERKEQARPKQPEDKPKKEQSKRAAESRPVGNQETCGEVRTVTLHKTHKQISDKEKQEEKIEGGSALSRLARDLVMSPSPSPSSSPALSDLSGGNFAPDYTEEPDGQAWEPASQGPVYSLTPEAIKFLVERPSQQATAIAAVSSQIIATNHCLTDIAAKINEEHKTQDPLLHTVLVQIKSLVADVRDELRTANKNAEEERELRKTTNIALRDLTSALRQQDATNRALQTALATQGMLPGPSSTAPPAPAMDPSILKMAGEFDVDWAALQRDHETTKTQRRPEWPNFNTP